MGCRAIPDPWFAPGSALPEPGLTSPLQAVDVSTAPAVAAEFHHPAMVDRGVELAVSRRPGTEGALVETQFRLDPGRAGLGAGDRGSVTIRSEP